MRQTASNHEKGERLTTTKLGMQRYQVFKRSVRDHRVSTQRDWKAALSSNANPLCPRALDSPITGKKGLYLRISVGEGFRCKYT